ncbi:dystroglycan [Biomphalaria pfeifferi]|uniref:Dystroglycan 1 n=1 Tax=Biomphalaria pfeifferi TaxID=112525 RepID=A0AAD8F5E1_BIOPF|nr:dystroglycan [Biomphalaria pfeifferi]
MNLLYTGLVVFLLAPLCHQAGGQAQGEDVAVKWGVADGTATVGRLFRMHIPSDAFSGDVVSLSIQTLDGSSLPSWLQFDDVNNVLQGIATPKDAGQLFLVITAKGKSSQASVTFTLIVRDVTSHTLGAPLRFKSSGAEFVHCKATEPETVATVVVDVDMESLSVTQRIMLMKSFSSHMQLHEDMVKLTPVGSSPLHDNSALVSGTGDAVSPKTPGMFISWPVGCGQVKDGHFPVLQRLDTDSGSGVMSGVLGHPVIGWYVTNSHLLTPTRKRRQVQATPTPVVTPVIPTKTDKTGDKTDDPTDMLTHAIVDKETPSMIQPTSTQPEMPKTALPTPVDTKPPVKPPKVMPTETTIKVQPMEKTAEIKPTKTIKDGEPTKPPVEAEPTKPSKPIGCLPGKKLTPVKEQEVISMLDGNVYIHPLRDVAFKDCDTEIIGLEYTLKKSDGSNLGPEDLIQFNAKTQTIHAFPINQPGKVKYTLTASKNGVFGFKTINIEVKQHKRGAHSQNFKAVIDHDFDKLSKNTTEKIDIAHRLASVFNKEIKDFQFHEILVGSVIYSWSFQLSRKCGPKDLKEIGELVDKLINEDSTLNSVAVDMMKPYKLTGAETAPLGPCLNNPNFPTRSVKDKKMSDVDKDDDKTAVTPKQESEEDDGDDEVTTSSDVTKTDVAKGSKGGDDDDVWITTVVPAVVIIVILLIALLVACCLYRKKRKGKMNVEEQNTFINKGAPVIFPDELEDKPSDVNKPLLVEGSPAPPPEYHRGPSESPERNLGGNFRNNGNTKPMTQNDEGIIEMPERPYNPPAPPVGGSVNNKQPRPTQQPFSQPPQILP